MAAPEASTRFPFSEARIRDFRAPLRGRVYLHDSATPHLQICVTEKGARTFYYGRRISGRPTRIRLGTVGELTVQVARRLAQQLTGQIAEGKDPHHERQLAKRAPTLGDLWAWWEKTMIPRKKTGQRDVSYWSRFLQTWKQRSLQSIKRRDVQHLHGEVVAKHGPITANRLIGLLKAMFNAAEHVGYEGSNPCRKLLLAPEQSREVYLDGEDLRRFFAALEEEAEPWPDFFKTCLFTGARKGNVMAMQWADLDLHTGLWRLGENKSGKPVAVPLSEPAVQLLERRRREATGESPWVFPTPRNPLKPIRTAQHAWERVIARAGLEGKRIHDLRRTLGSWQAIGGSSLQIIGKSLGHTSLAATEVYARLSMDPVRQSVEQATSKMLEYVEGEQ